MSNKYYPENTDLHYVDISHEKERQLFAAARTGDKDAREFLIKNHLLYAAIQGQRWSAGKLPEDEVISAANFALMQAIDKFDHTRENRFTSYLRKFIRGELAALWRSKNVVDAPAHPESGSWSRSFDDDAGTRMNHETCEHYTPENVNLPTEDHPSEQDDHSQFISQALEKCRASLPASEAEIISLHFGEHNLTMADIAKLKGVSRERIRQIKESGLKRLRTAMKRLMSEAGVERA
jgi:RNA polymerase primary sigma factor